MKQVSIFLALVLTSFTIAAQNLNMGLAAYYSFNGNANDQSGNNNNPIFNNATPTAGRNGSPNTAYLFNGASSYIEIPNSSSLNPSRITLYALVKPQGFYQGACHGNVILSKGVDEFPDGWYSLLYSDAVFNAGLNCSNPVDSLHQNFYGGFGRNGAVTSPYTPYVTKEEWYSVVLTFDGSTTRFYVNGNQVASKAGSFIYGGSGLPLFLGKMNNPTFPYWFKGVIDEVRIYNRALTAQEVGMLSKDCSEVTVNTGSDWITIAGLSGVPHVGIQVFNSAWASVSNEIYSNQNNLALVNGLPSGQYFVNVRFYSEAWTPICEKTIEVYVNRELICNSISIHPGNNGTIQVEGLNGPNTTIQIFDSKWATVFNQAYSPSPNTAIVPQLGEGTFFVRVAYYSTNWTFICDKGAFVTVAAGSGAMAPLTKSKIVIDNAQNRIVISPNPFASSLRVSIKGLAREKVTMVLSDVFGRQLMSRQVQLNEGQNIISMDGLGRLPVGSYYLRVISGNKVESFRVLRQE